MSFYREVLPETQQRVLGELGPVAMAAGYYLGGGTAVALHVGHRQSIDLDWFRPAPLDAPLELASEIRDAGLPLDVSSVAPGTLHGRCGAVRVSFLTYRYDTLEALVPWPEMGCQVASLRDLACMKLAAAAQRGSRKDLVDVAVLLDRFTLSEMLASYSARYGVDDTTHVLYGLTYFDDAESEPSPRMLARLSWAQVKERLMREVARVAGKA
ncbi:MAG: hypothetical protein EP329_02490 [Deltaproteobacteria bacterium]|nr:MAG: hypothetical protein EP329_02490 [Deltaproteobacteria bacterium]